MCGCTKIATEKKIESKNVGYYRTFKMIREGINVVVCSNDIRNDFRAGFMAFSV